MSEKLKEELERLVGIIIQHLDGMSVEELLKFLEKSTSKGTLQHRLSSLVKDGVLRHEGAGRKSKYYAKEIKESKQGGDASPTISIIPLTIEARELKRFLSVPIQLRKHVSYQREFLESYKPNFTYYLSEQIRKKLLVLGVEQKRGVLQEILQELEYAPRSFLIGKKTGDRGCANCKSDLQFAQANEEIAAWIDINLFRERSLQKSNL